jgi:tRNA(adenine34) deaminase
MDVLPLSIYRPYQPTVETTIAVNGGLTEYMDLALEQAEKALESGNPPVGAVLLDMRTGEHWMDFTQDITSENPSDHGEQRVMQRASQGLYLGRHALITTVEPCPACTTQYAQTKIGAIVHAASRADATFQRQDREITMDRILDDSQINTLVVSGLRQPEAAALIKEYTRLRDTAHKPEAAIAAPADLREHPFLQRFALDDVTF